jgi:RNA-binding protein YhbY
MSGGVAKFQIGKNGLTSGAIESLHLAFKTRKVVRITVLKSAFSERGNIKEIAEEISKKLDGKYNFKIIGFTIVMKRMGAEK